jgi:transposase
MKVYKHIDLQHGYRQKKIPRRSTALLFVLPKSIAPYVPRRTPQPKHPIIANLLKLSSDLMA